MHIRLWRHNAYRAEKFSPGARISWIPFRRLRKRTSRAHPSSCPVSHPGSRTLPPSSGSPNPLDFYRPPSNRDFQLNPQRSYYVTLQGTEQWLGAYQRQVKWGDRSATSIFWPRSFWPHTSDDRSRHLTSPYTSGSDSQLTSHALWGLFTYFYVINSRLLTYYRRWEVANNLPEWRIFSCRVHKLPRRKQ